VGGFLGGVCGVFGGGVVVVVLGGVVFGWLGGSVVGGVGVCLGCQGGGLIVLGPRSPNPRGGKG